MKRFVALLVAVIVLTSMVPSAEARLFGRRGRGGGGGYGLSGGPCATAQDCANLMASQGRVGHPGGNPGYEGCGSGGSWQAAYNNCCFANSGMATVDYGLAQGSNGMWFACRRYGNAAQRVQVVSPRPVAPVAPMVTSEAPVIGEPTGTE